MVSFFIKKKGCNVNFTIKDLYECFFELLILYIRRGHSHEGIFIQRNNPVIKRIFYLFDAWAEYIINKTVTY